MLTLHRPTATQDRSEPATAAFIATLDRSSKRNGSTSLVSQLPSSLFRRELAHVRESQTATSIRVQGPGLGPHWSLTEQIQPTLLIALVGFTLRPGSESDSEFTRAIDVLKHSIGLRESRTRTAPCLLSPLSKHQVRH
jgi:hypothetical protein